jgi:type-F conjugative transfer system secretin TraK
MNITNQLLRLRQLMVTLLGVLSYSPWTSIYGLVTAEIDDTQKLKVTLSTKDTNRITIDNSRIAQVFGVEELMAIQFDEENGQCFVKAKTNPGHPVTLTLITEEGETQDLEVTFADVPSELVLLHSLKKDLKPLSEVVGDDEENVHAEAIELMKQIVRQQIPKGFTVMGILDAKEKVLRTGGTVRTLKHLTGRGWEILMGTVRNPTDAVIRIKESALASDQDIAVYLSQGELHPGQAATCVMIRKRG